jgi:hypothetical protein
MSHTTLAAAEFFIRWQSADARHTDMNISPRSISGAISSPPAWASG